MGLHFTLTPPAPTTQSPRLGESRYPQAALGPSKRAPLRLCINRPNDRKYVSLKQRTGCLAVSGLVQVWNCFCRLSKLGTCLCVCVCSTTSLRLKSCQNGACVVFPGKQQHGPCLWPGWARCFVKRSRGSWVDHKARWSWDALCATGDST